MNNISKEMAGEADNERLEQDEAAHEAGGASAVDSISSAAADQASTLLAESNEAPDDLFSLAVDEHLSSGNEDDDSEVVDDGEEDDDADVEDDDDSEVVDDDADQSAVADDSGASKPPDKPPAPPGTPGPDDEDDEEDDDADVEDEDDDSEVVDDGEEDDDADVEDEDDDSEVVDDGEEDDDADVEDEDDDSEVVDDGEEDDDADVEDEDDDSEVVDDGEEDDDADVEDEDDDSEVVDDGEEDDDADVEDEDDDSEVVDDGEEDDDADVEDEDDDSEVVDDGEEDDDADVEDEDDDSEVVDDGEEDDEVSSIENPERRESPADPDYLGEQIAAVGALPEGDGWWARTRRFVGGLVRQKRRATARDDVTQLENAGRTAAGAGAGWFGTSLLTQSPHYATQLVTGAGSWIGKGLVFAADYLPGVGGFAYDYVRSKRAKARYETNVQDSFHEAIAAQNRGTNVDIVNQEGAELAQYQNQTDRELIDTHDEQDLLVALDKVFPPPAEIPHLVSLNRYARYCYARFTHICRRATAEQLQNVHDLSGKDREILRRFDLTNPEIEAEEKNQRKHKLYQVSVSYARLLQNEHDKKSGAVNGALAASALTVSATTGGLVPIAAFGTYYGYKRGQRWLRTRASNLEFGENGRVRGKDNRPMADPEVLKPERGTLFQEDVLASHTKPEHLTDEGRKWLAKMPVPQFVNERNYRTVRSLAFDCGPYVLDALSKQKAEPVAATDDEKQLAREKMQQERQTHEQLQGDLRLQKKEVSTQRRELDKKKQQRLTILQKSSALEESADNVNALEQELENLNQKKDELVADKTASDLLIDDASKARSKKLEQDIKEKEKEIAAKQKQMDTAKQKMEDEKAKLTPSDRSSLNHLDADIESAESALVEAEEASNNLQEAVDQQKTKAEEAVQEYNATLKPEASDEPVGIDAVVGNQDIVQAFCVKMHQIFDARSEQQGKILSFLGKGAGSVATSTPAKEVGKASAVTGIYAGLAYLAVTYGPGFLSTIINPPAAAGVAGTVGLAKYILDRLKK